MKRPDIEPGPVLARLDAGRDEVRVEIRVVAGQPFVDVRRWGRGEAGPYPTPRGLLVPLDLAPRLAAALAGAFSHRRPYAASVADSDHSPSPERAPATAGLRSSPRRLPEPSHSTPAGRGRRRSTTS